jgi:hypothetical protein
MTKPQIHGVRATLSASAVRTALGDELSLIRQQDGLTWSDIGRIIGKSEDQAAKYADGSAEMGVVAFAFAKKEWNGRFTGALDRLVDGVKPSSFSDRTCESKVLHAALSLSIALSDDDEITPSEVRANRATIEAARDALNGLLAKLAPVAA